MNDPEINNTFESNTYVLQCPLDKLTSDQLSCDTTAFLGVSYYSHSMNQSAAYLWSGHAFNNHNIVALSQNEVQQAPEGKYEKEIDEELTTIYQLDFETGTVGGVQVDSSEFTERSFKIIGDTFSAVVGKNTGGDKNIYGLSFSVDLFSSTPVILSESHYQPLDKESCDIYVNRIFGDYLFLGVSLESESSDYNYQSLIWDINENELQKYPVYDYPMYYFQQGSNVIGISEDQNNLKVLIAVWALEPELKLLSMKEFDDIVFSKSIVAKNNDLTTPSGGSIWVGTQYRFDEYRREIEYVGYRGQVDALLDMSFFVTELNGNIKRIGQVQSKPLEVNHKKEDDCRFGCNDWRNVETFFVAGEFVFVFVNDQVIKSKITESGVEVLNRFYLLSDSFND